MSATRCSRHSVQAPPIIFGSSATSLRCRRERPKADDGRAAGGDGPSRRRDNYREPPWSASGQGNQALRSNHRSMGRAFEPDALSEGQVIDIQRLSNEVFMDLYAKGLIAE